MTWETPKCYPMHYSILLTFTQMDWNTENTHISMQNAHANNAHHALFEHTLLVLDIIWSETFFLLMNWVLGKKLKIISGFFSRRYFCQLISLICPIYPVLASNLNKRFPEMGESTLTHSDTKLSTGVQYICMYTYIYIYIYIY